jgi:hypothetical protein
VGKKNGSTENRGKIIKTQNYVSSNKEPKGCLTEFVGSTPNHEKNFGTPTQPINTNFSQKSMFSTIKICMEATQ